MPPASVIQGTTVRLAQDGLTRRLRFDNPNVRQSCGCGESFASLTQGYSRTTRFFRIQRSGW